VGRLCTRRKYLRIKKNAYELLWGILTLLLKEFKSLRKGLVDPSFPTRVVKEENRGEGKFRAPGEKSGKRSGIFPGLNSSIISLISNFKMF
jgi:hypothetical protein